MQIAREIPQIRRRWHVLIDRERWLGPLFLGPAVGYIVLLIGVPFGLAIYLSFTNAIAGSLNAEFIGFRNFELIWRDPVFQWSLTNTFIFTFVSQLIVLVLAKILALALMQSFPGRPLVRFLILLPWVAPIALTTTAWKFILDPTYSIVSWTLQVLHLMGPTDWMGYSSTLTGMISIIIIHVWRMLPFATVIILAGLTSIPQDLIDAARVDGAGAWRRLFEITLPLMLPVVAVAVLFGIIFTFTDMTVVRLLTNGAPFDTTQVLASLAFRKGIDSRLLGQGAAVALFLVPMLIVVAVLMLRYARRTEVN
jgi:multiple sugar transport system permease protein